MYSVAVKDHVMIAHSFRGDVFGPAQRMHGATFVITALFKSPQLDSNGIVIDIGAAHQALAQAVEPIRYRNLDEMKEFDGANTTTEYLAHWIHGKVADRVTGSFAGVLRITLEESHVAWGSYEAPCG